MRRRLTKSKYRFRRTPANRRRVLWGQAPKAVHRRLAFFAGWGCGVLSYPACGLGGAAFSGILRAMGGERRLPNWSAKQLNPSTDCLPMCGPRGATAGGCCFRWAESDIAQRRTAATGRIRQLESLKKLHPLVNPVLFPAARDGHHQVKAALAGGDFSLIHLHFSGSR